MMKRSTLKTLYLILPLTLLPLLLPLRRPTKPLSWTATDNITNITLRISGTCTHPITYLGVDSRAHLLNYYDISATPTESYSAAKINWARVSLLQQAFLKCRNVPYFVYSDTDAYMNPRELTYQRIRLQPHVIYQRGMWKLNSGFSSWRNSKESLRVLAKWYNNYTPEEDFYAEQRALLHATGNLSSLCEPRENGFLGWHIKGKPPFKTEIANLGRRLWYYEDHITYFMLIPLSALLAYTVFATLLVRFTGSVNGTKPFVQAAVVIGRLLRSDLFVLLCTGAVLTILLFTQSNFIGEWRLEPTKLWSVHNFAHIIPHGRILVDKKLICSRTWCVRPTERSFTASVQSLLMELSKHRITAHGIFFTYGLIAILLPRVLLAFVIAGALMAVVSVLVGAVNLSNPFVMLDVADGNFRRARKVFGDWSVRGVKPTARSGSFEVVHKGDVSARLVGGQVV